MSISTLLNQMDRGDVVLPAIQRDFVWPEDKIFMLLDSIMRGYPLGIVLMWETYDDLRYREFVKDVREINRQTFKDNVSKRRLNVVLDGQQRLQSLYLALYGSNEGKYLSFDVLSGRESNDLREMVYYFRFSTPDEDVQHNEETFKTFSERKTDDNNGDQMEWYMRFQDLFRMSVSEKKKLSRDLTTKLQLTDDDSLRLDMNLARIDEVMSKEESILKTSVIDENKPLGSPDRKSEADVLEVFVRINRQGTPLSRSDLIFSMLKLDWKESAETLPEFVDSINEGNAFQFDADFVIRCLFTVSGLGSKLNIDLLRNKVNIEKFKKNFAQCCNAIRSLVDVVQRDCWCSSSKAFAGNNTFVPFVYYLHNLPKHQVPNADLKPFRQALYLCGFTRAFQRFADSRIGKIVSWEMYPRISKGDFSFPIGAFVKWMTKTWFQCDRVSPGLLQNNVYLTHCLVQGFTGAKVHLPSSALEMDHIFPRSKLRDMKFEEHELNHFANFWLLAKGKNQNKSAKDPKEFFADVNDEDLQRAFIDREMLDYGQFREFLKIREARLISEVESALGFSADGF